MPVLRRSCQACASAKRRCSLGAPRCIRCSARSIACRYVNEPAAVVHVRKTASYYHTNSTQYSAAFGDAYISGVFSNRRDTGLQIYFPLRLEVVRVFDTTTLHHLVSILRNFPVEFAQRGANSFVHSGMYDSRLPSPLQHVQSICAATRRAPLSGKGLGALRLTVRQLSRLATHASSFTELVACVQAIILMQILRLFRSEEPIGDDVERDNETMWKLSHKLWEDAPVQLPSTLSPWRAWLFAENVRRTILVCNVLLGVHGALRRGFAIHALCIETLPFDMRTKLWDAETADEWMAASLTSPEPSLVTFRQFQSLRRQTLGASNFEDLLSLSFKGRHYIAGSDSEKW